MAGPLKRLFFRRPTLAHILLAVLSLTALSQAALGLVLYRRLRSRLEADLARRLTQVATSLAQSVDGRLVAQFREGDESLAAYGLVRRRLRAQAEAAGAIRAYVFDRRSRTLVDTDEAAEPGLVRHRLLAQESELARVFEGLPVATRLYDNELGQPQLSAFAPLRGPDGVVSIAAGVDAPPSFFAALTELRREMLLLGLGGIGLVALGGALVVRQVAARLERLRRMVAGGTSPDPAAGLAPQGRDTIGALGRDLEQLVAALVAGREYQEAVLGSVEVGIVTCDAEERLTLVNRRARELLGEQERELAGRPLSDVLASQPALRALARTVAEADANAEIPVAGGIVSGGRVLAASASRLLRGGHPSGLVLSLLDVTALREAERRARENERLAALGGMAGGLLHEVGNPMAAIGMYLDLLRPLVGEGEAGELLERALREEARVREFLEDFRIFAGLAPVRQGSFELFRLYATAAEPLAWPARIERTLAGSGRARGDLRLLAHAVRNLLRNAIEALSGAGRVAVSLQRRGGEARVVVSDDGPGLDAVQIERVFEPFHTTKPHGSGLGLLVVRRVAELHGGRLDVRSQPGSGAEFSLRWPVAGEGEHEWRAS